MTYITVPTYIYDICMYHLHGEFPDHIECIVISNFKYYEQDVMPKCNKINMRKKCHCLSSVKRYPEHVSAAGRITFEMNPENETCSALICLIV